MRDSTRPRPKSGHLEVALYPGRSGGLHHIPGCLHVKPLECDSLSQELADDPHEVDRGVAPLDAAR